MKSNILKAACAVAALCAAGQADAAANAMTISGSSFEDTGPTVCVSRFSAGISNACSGDTNFIYGIPKGPGTAGYTVTFTGNNSSSAVTSSYTVFSNSSSGGFLAMNSGTVSVAGNWSRSLPFSAAQAPASGRLTAYIGLPASFQANFYGLSLAY